MLNENIIRLKACRKRGGLDQVELATLVGMNFHTVSRFERGLTLPDAPTLIAYELIFDMPAAQLLPATMRVMRKQTLRRALDLQKRCGRSSLPQKRGKTEFLEALCQRLEGTTG